MDRSPALADHKRGETARVPTPTSFEMGAELEQRLGQEKVRVEIKSQANVVCLMWPCRSA